MVKSNALFSQNYKESRTTEENIINFFEEEGFNILEFDIQSEFEKCNEVCPIKVDHCGQKMPYARWTLYKNITRPDLIVNYNKPLLIEIKHKNKKYIWVNSRDYKDYIKWNSILNIPLYILIFVKSEGCYYLHKIEKDISNLDSLITRHDNNEVYDLEKKSLRFDNLKKLINFLKELD
jgi:Holliday junction resolvase